MSNSKYDWAIYMPRMIELYSTGMSIPDIHKAIQDVANGFTPRVRIVYSKFNAEGYPTDQAARAQRLKSLNIARWPVDVSTSIRSTNRRLLPAVPDTSSSDDPVNIDPASIRTGIGDDGTQTQVRECNNTVDTSTFLWTVLAQEPLESPVGATSIFHPVDASFGDLLAEPSPFSHAAVVGFQEQHEGDWEFGGLDPLQHFDMQCLAPGAFDTPMLSNSTISGHILDVKPINDAPSVLSEGYPQRSPTPGDREESRWSTSAVGLDKCQRRAESPSTRSKLPLRPTARYSGSSNSSTLDGRSFSSKPRPKYNRSCTPEKHNSVSTSDSGYSSGRNSPLLQLTPVSEAHDFHPQSLGEFKGLHRVPCQNLHEPPPYNELYMPQSQDRFKDTPTCSQCLYSAIHNLSWSAIYLKLEVFRLELKSTKSELERHGIYDLDGLYDIEALDAAGNSALHYAASGGAGFEHFISLIQTGVNPYQLNTAGQLFVHCWRPRIQKPKQKILDEDLVALFNADFVDLLNHFQNTTVFKWRDNEGRTMWESLACVLAPRIREQTFQHVINAGYPFAVLGQFDRPITEPKPSNHQYSSPGAALSPYNMETEIGENFSTKQERQIRAWEILDRAAMEASYVDPETGDNVLHALSRVKISQAASLISKIQSFTSKDVDLNLHNKERDCPLATFIRERPVLGVENDETGATMSKYLDALLWKDPRNRIPNRINVNMRNRSGATALYYAAIRARPDSVRSLIEAGANVNARRALGNHHISILQATHKAKTVAVVESDAIKIHQFNNVISYLEHENAVLDPTVFEERRLCPNSVRVLPM